MNMKGWTPVLVEDFDTNAAMGQVLTSAAYRDKISAYPTGYKTSKPWQTGMYDTGRLEVKNSCLISNIATITDSRGTWPRVTAIRPMISPAKPWGVDHGRFVLRFRIPQPLPGYKIAWLLWPDSGTWPRDGEIDFPEQDIGSASTVVKGFMHRQNATQGSDQAWAKGTTAACDGKWHTAQITWKPGDWRTRECEFRWDGTALARWRLENDRIPNTDMHWVIQTEPKLGTYAKPDPKVSGTIEIDWLAYYRSA
jgi:hypothetical protein